MSSTGDAHTIVYIAVLLAHTLITGRATRHLHTDVV